VPLLPVLVDGFYSYKDKQVVKSAGMFSLCHWCWAKTWNMLFTTPSLYT